MTIATKESSAAISAAAPVIADAGAEMATVADASAALSASVNTSKEAVNAFGETAEMSAARHKAIAAAYAEQAAAGGQITLSERAIAEATGQRIESTAAQIAATQASIVAQDA
jgi:hypothetical protein